MLLVTQRVHRAPGTSAVRAELPGQRAYLLAVARSIVGSACDADDLVQETFRRALEHEDQFMVDTNLRAWLTCILRNVHRDRLRRGALEVLSPLIGEVPGLEPAVPPPDADLPSWRSVGDTDVAAAMQGLPARYREVYLLREAGWVYEDIARQLGLSVNTVATRIHRARLWLRRQLTEGHEAPGQKV